MDKRKLNRITAVFLTLLVLVVAFMLSGSFRRTSRVVLPQESQQDEQISGFPGDSTDVLTVVAVAPDTVQQNILVGGDGLLHIGGDGAGGDTEDGLLAVVPEISRFPVR